MKNQIHFKPEKEVLYGLLYEIESKETLETLLVCFTLAEVLNELKGGKRR